jgi:hypothetical protein
MVVAAAGLVILAAQLGVHTSYPSTILPALVVIGLGLGLVFACAINTATYGAAREDAGVASAMVNTNQQVGGSIGTALLNTIAASAFSSYLVTHGPSPAAQAGAAVHSYIVAFWVSPAFSPPPRSCAGSCCPPASWRRPRPRSPRPRHDQEEMRTRDFRSR